MRLRYLLNLLNNTYPGLELLAKFNGSNNTYLFNGVNRFKESIAEIEPTNLFEGEIAKLYASELFQTKQDQIVVERVAATEIINNSKQIRDITKALVTAIRQLLPEEKENSIDIKLPAVNQFEDLITVSGQINQALSQTILDADIGGTIQIEGVEPGSIWLRVYVNTASAVILIGGMVWAGAVISKKIHEDQILIQKVRALEINNDGLLEIQGKQKQALDLMIEGEAKLLLDENYKDKRPEQLERLKLAIRTFAELLGKGAEVQPSLMAPESVNNLFPPSLQGAISRVPQLQSKN